MLCARRLTECACWFRQLESREQSAERQVQRCAIETAATNAPSRLHGRGTLQLSRTEGSRHRPGKAACQGGMSRRLLDFDASGAQDRIGTHKGRSNSGEGDCRGGLMQARCLVGGTGFEPVTPAV